jgi:2-polyprenyl-3-methyl-5-hydroxy-6-metoxy-1,4-benzoquinol methylase
MKFTDRFLQRWRIRKAAAEIGSGARILDIGSADGALFTALGPRVGAGSLGVDPALARPQTVNGHRLLPGFFPAAVPAGTPPFDVITMLAVLEQFPPDAYESLRGGCETFLKPGGKLLITVPSPQVDKVLAILQLLRLMDATSLEEHHGYDVSITPDLFPPPTFRLVRRKTFQLGLNHFFIFERTDAK